MEMTAWKRFRAGRRRAEASIATGSRTERISAMLDKLGFKGGKPPDCTAVTPLDLEELELLVHRVIICASTMARLQEGELEGLNARQHPLVEALTHLLKHGELPPLLKAETAIALSRLHAREQLDDAVFRNGSNQGQSGEDFDFDPVVGYLLRWCEECSGAERNERLEAALCGLYQVCILLGTQSRERHLVPGLKRFMNPPPSNGPTWQPPSAHAVEMVKRIEGAIRVSILENS